MTVALKLMISEEECCVGKVCEKAEFIARTLDQLVCFEMYGEMYVVDPTGVVQIVTEKKYEETDNSE